MKKTLKDGILTAAGLLLLAIGIVIIKTTGEADKIMRALPYVCIGIGCGMFGNGMGNIIQRSIMKKDPKLAKAAAIEANDERNTAISNRAKAKAFDIMTYVFGALMLSFALMGIELAAVLLMVCAYLFVIGCSIYYRGKYEREM